jgi:hypothetical protein
VSLFRHAPKTISGDPNHLSSARAARILGPLRRATHRVAAVALLKKSIFNLRIDPMQPLLGALGSFLIGSDFCL